MSELLELFEISVGTSAGASFLERAGGERQLGRIQSAAAAEAAWHLLRVLGDEPEGESSQAASDWARRRASQLLDRLPPEDTEAAHLRGILEAASAGISHRAGVLRMALSAYAYYLEHGGRYESALEVLRAAIQTGGVSHLHDSLPLALFVARARSALARWQEAERAWMLADRMAVETGDLETAMAARLGLAGVLAGRDDLAGAERTVCGVLQQAREAGWRDLEGRAMGELAGLLARQGRPADAVVMRYDSLDRLRDPTQRARVLAEIGAGLRAAGIPDAARCALQLALADGPEPRQAARVHVELLGLEAELDNRVGFERERVEAARLESAMDPPTLVAYRYHAGTGLLRFGTIPRGRAMLREALRVAESHQLRDWYFRIDGVLRDIGSPAPAEVDPGVPAADLQRVAKGLRDSWPPVRNDELPGLS